MDSVLKILRPNFVKVDKFPHDCCNVRSICGENYDYFDILNIIVNTYPLKETKVYYKVIRDGDIDFYYFAEVKKK